METRAGWIYEVSCFVDEDAAQSIANRLEDVARRALEHPGIVDVRIHEQPGDAGAERLWIVEYVLGAEAGVEELAASGILPATGDSDSPFGAYVRCTTRLLSEAPAAPQAGTAGPECLNCGAPLTGQYCGQCGQRARSRLISLWELVTDAFGDLFELDSRLWRTLIPLVVRPGRLTDEYLKGRRVRFMPPFRMYLVLSLVFFLVAFTDPREKFGILFEAPPAASDPADSAELGAEASPDVPAAVSDPNEAERIRQEILEDLSREGLLTTEESRAIKEATGDDVRIGLGSGEGEIRCDVEESDLDELPDFLARRLTVERLQHVCEQLQLDDGRSFADGVINAIPTALIVLLPVLAFVLAALYPLSRRYYVEHLLFLVHFHAFFFLLLTLQILFARAATWMGLPDTARILALVATSFYVPVYLLVAMRRVYGQGRFITFLKFTVLTSAYLAGFTMTMLTVAIFVAFSL